MKMNWPAAIVQCVATLAVGALAWRGLVPAPAALAFFSAIAVSHAAQLQRRAP